MSCKKNYEEKRIATPEMVQEYKKWLLDQLSSIKEYHQSKFKIVNENLEQIAKNIFSQEKIIKAKQKILETWWDSGERRGAAFSLLLIEIWPNDKEVEEVCIISSSFAGGTYRSIEDVYYYYSMFVERILNKNFYSRFFKLLNSITEEQVIKIADEKYIVSS